MNLQGENDMTLDELEAKCQGCEKCELCKGRTNLVFGVGKKDADIMLIGEGPGENEDLQGEPFVGRSGKLLDKFLESIDLSRDKNVYIANMVKCRPPQNRDPKPAEQEICLEWLREQFKIIRPKIIICVGRISAQKLISPDFKVTQQHGEFIEKSGVLMMGTYHPAAILRNPNNKELAFADWLKVRDKIEELGIEI
jgi:DNA polymerase